MSFPGRSRLAVLCLISASCLFAQNQGFNISGASAYTSFSGVGSGAAGSAGPDGTGFGNGGSASFGWSRGNDVRGVAISYTPSYFFTRGSSYSSATFLSHNLSLTGNMKLRPKLFLEFSAAGQVVRSQENLFATSLLSRTAQSSTSIADLAIKPNDAQNSQAQTSFLAIGTRYLTSVVALRLAYRATPRLSINVRAEGNRVQTLERAVASPMIATTGATVGAGFSYALSPRTLLGAEVNSQQMWLAPDRTRTTNLIASLGRGMGRQWFIQVQAGSGFVSSTQVAYGLRTAPQFIGGGTIGYRTNAHAFIATAARSLADQYGLHGSATQSFIGAWNWQKPGRRWTVFASAGNQTLSIPGSSSLSIWHANAGWTRAVNRDTDISIMYAYGTFLQGLMLSPSLTPRYTFAARHGVQMVVHWHPPKATR